MVASVLNLTESEIKKSTAVLRAINHELRNSILELIHSRPGITVTEIYTTIRQEQSLTSQHLAFLKKENIDENWFGWLYGANPQFHVKISRFF